jgi:hypothetical protein
MPTAKTLTSSLKLPMIALVGVLSLAGADAAWARPHSRVSVHFVVNTPPPPLRVERVLVRPSRRAVWVPGYWDWQPARRDYVWVGGRWDTPPRRGAAWVKPRWERQGRSHVYFRGYWR